MEAAPHAREVERLLAEGEWIRRLAIRLLGDAQQAEDLAQETRLAALRTPPRDTEGSLRPWLATVARNAAHKWHRTEAARRARETERARDRAQEAGSSPEELLAQLESQELVARLVRELPEELADVLLLSFFEGHTSESIARLRKIPAGTVRWRKKQALERLRERLDAHYAGDRSAWMAAFAPWVASIRRPEATAVASGGGIFAGLLAPWIAMNGTAKLLSIALIAALLTLPFALGEDDEWDRTESVAVSPASELVEPPPSESPTAPAPEEPATEPFGPGRTAISAPSEPKPDEPPVTRVRLRVVDSLGRPVPDATVQLQPSAEVQATHAMLLEELSALDLAGLMSQLERETDFEGVARWESDLLRSDGLVTFRAVGPRQGVGSLSAALEQGADMDLGDLVLTPAGGVTGRVLDPKGAAPKSIRVVLREVLRNDAGEEREESAGTILTGVASARTDDRGEFVLDGIPTGEYRAYVQVQQGVQPFRSAPFQVELGMVTRHVEVYCDTPLDRPVEAWLRVLGADGKPLTSALVRVEKGGLSSSGSVSGDGTWGRFAPSLHLFAGGRLEVSDAQFRHKTFTIDPLPDPLESIVVRMEAAPFLERTLQLRTPRGEFPREARLLMHVGEQAYGFDIADPAHTVPFPANPTEPVRVTLTANGCQTLTLEGLVPAELDEPWKITLLEQKGIQGLVLADGEPVERARVSLHHTVEEGRISRKGNDVNHMLFSKADEQRTGSNGRFVLHQAEAGRFVVQVNARGYAPVCVPLGEYDPLVGVQDLVIELHPGGRVEGQVLDHLGQPVPRALVVLDHPLFQAKRKRAGRDGRFSFRNVPAGDWYLHRVFEFEDGFFNTTEGVPEGWSFPSNCTVRSDETTTMNLVLPNPASSSVTATWKGATSSKRPLELRIVRETGTFSERDPFLEDWEARQVLVPGEPVTIDVRAEWDYELQLTTPGCEGRLVRPWLAADLPADFDVAIEWGYLRWEVAEADESEGALPWISLRWTDGEWTFRQTVWPASDGSWPQVLVPAGEVLVETGRTQQSQPHQQTVVVSSDETVTVSIP